MKIHLYEAMQAAGMKPEIVQATAEQYPYLYALAIHNVLTQLQEIIPEGEEVTQEMTEYAAQRIDALVTRAFLGKAGVQLAPAALMPLETLIEAVRTQPENYLLEESQIPAVSFEE